MTLDHEVSFKGSVNRSVRLLLLLSSNNVCVGIHTNNNSSFMWIKGLDYEMV